MATGTDCTDCTDLEERRVSLLSLNGGEVLRNASAAICASHNECPASYEPTYPSYIEDDDGWEYATIHYIKGTLTIKAVNIVRGKLAINVKFVAEVKEVTCSGMTSPPTISMDEEFRILRMTVEQEVRAHTKTICADDDHVDMELEMKFSD